MPAKTASEIASASVTSRISAPRFGVSRRSANGQRSPGSFMGASRRASWTDVAGTRRALEAADRFRQEHFRQPQDDIREQHGECDRGKEYDVKRQRAHDRLAEADAHVFG